MQRRHFIAQRDHDHCARAYRFKSDAITETSSYLKLAESTQVTLVVAAAGRFYGLRRFITVVGNCG